MRMHNPPHPGVVIRELCLRPLGLTVTQAAAALGVSRKTLSAILNARAGISPEMAIHRGRRGCGSCDLARLAAARRRLATSVRLSLTAAAAP